MSYKKYASIILELAINKTLDYGILDEQLPHIKKGVLVEVLLKGAPRRGYVFEIKESPEVAKVLPIRKVLSENELITEDLFEIAVWIAKYYYSPLSQVIKSLLPGSIRRQIEPKQQLFVTRAKTREELKQVCEELRTKSPAQALVLDVMLLVSKGIFLSELIEETDGSRSPVDTLCKKGLLNIEEVRVGISPILREEYFQTKPKILNEEQKNALGKITESLKAKRFETHLLFGVTGSGKTEVYLQAIQCALEAGKSALMLVPEIALTAQTVERFRSRFQDKIAILHHRLSDGERFEEWHRIRKGEAKIVIGARSAIFCPIQNLGLIIVDEEHEHSYKQTDESPCYHARDVAVMRGLINKAVVVLGSATPSLESFFNADQKKYTLSTLSHRAANVLMPSVTIVDMKKECGRAGGFTLFSDELLRGIKQRQEVGEQTILFLNRRGYYTTHLCRACSHVIQCPNCDLNLTFHQGEQILACHLCGHLQRPPKCCPNCKADDALKYRGAGTEQVERAINAIFKGIRTLRVDADTTRHKGSHEKLLREFRTGKADVLIGTQMISKGLHFPSVTLVGVLNSDSSLNIPDFRASENSFQLITQVSGRSGRGVIPGEVIIQTFLDDHPTIELAAKQDYLSFYKEEAETRKIFNYPPFNHMIKLTFTGENSEKTFELAKKMYDGLKSKLPRPFMMHPVVPAGRAKVKNKFRFQLILCGPSVYFMNRQLEEVELSLELSKDISISVDVDPLSTFF